MTMFNDNASPKRRSGPGAISRAVRRSVATAFVAIAACSAPAFAQPAIWTVKDADSIIYLLGTVHLLKPDTVWKTDKLEAALNEAQDVWLELPTTDPNAMAGEMMTLVSQYGLSPATPLSNDLTPEEMKTLDEAAKLAGLTGAQLNIFRPWFAALTISTAAITHAGFDPASGVDGKVEAAFRARGIAPKGLETAEQQIKVFANLSRDKELAYLRTTIDEYKKAATELDTLVESWSHADLATLEDIFVTSMKSVSPELYAALLTNRNANGAVKIEDMLKGKGVTFIAVGAGHLIGDDSVLAMLKAKGIASDRVQ
jgi:uncharacterized protein YbaP (TraB family)